MNLDVLIPSLLLPAPIQKLIPPPHVPALERMLARADRRQDPATDSAAWMCRRWGIDPPLPLAALLAEYDGLDTGNEGWLFAEPVHLVADRDAVKLYAGRSLGLEMAESAALVAALNAHFSGDGLAFFAPHPSRWYVSCPPAELPQTHAPAEAQRGSLAGYQPRSSGKLDWRSLQNEAQMLLFTHPVNSQREANGKTTVSGVWFWGGGVSGVRQAAIASPYEHVIADNPLAASLSRKSGIDPLFPAPAALNSLRGRSLLVLDACAKSVEAGDVAAWSAALEEIDREWFQPLMAGLADGRIAQLTIHAPDGDKTPSFHLTRRQRFMRFWRGNKALASHA